MQTHEEFTAEYNPNVTLQVLEDEWIAKAIIFYQGNMMAAAKQLGISRATLYRRVSKLRELGYRLPEASDVGK